LCPSHHLRPAWMGCGGAKAGQVTAQVQDGAKPKELPSSLKANPAGRFASVLPPSDEGRRDFARIFFANERKIFIAARGMPSIRPLQPTIGPSSAHIGDLSEQVVERARTLFLECVTAALAQVSGTAPDPVQVECLCSRAMLAMSVNVGLDFALHMQMLPTFLQPFFLVIVLGEPWEARVATYGFVAERPDQIVGDRPESKRTPFCVRLISPDLMGQADGQNWEVAYRVRDVRTTAIMQAVEGDMGTIRESTSSAKWEPLLQA